MSISPHMVRIHTDHLNVYEMDHSKPFIETSIQSAVMLISNNTHISNNRAV